MRRFNQKIRAWSDFKAFSEKIIFYYSKIEKSRFFEKFSKIENFQNALKSLLILRFCSNEHVIDIRWFSVGFWNKTILEKFWKNFRILKNFEKIEFFRFFFALVPDVYHAPHVRTSVTWECGPPKKLVQHHSFPTICLKFSNSW